MQRITVFIAALLVAATSLAAPALTSPRGATSDEHRVKAILREIREKEGHGTDRLIRELGNMGSRHGLQGLIRSLDAMQGPWSYGVIFSSCGAYVADEKHAPAALKFISKHAMSGQSDLAQAAAKSLAAMGDPAKDVARAVAKSGKSAEARAYALAALRADIVARADDRDLKLVLGGLGYPASGIRREIRELIQTFTSEKAMGMFAKYLGGKAPSEERARLVLDGLASHPLGESEALEAGIAAAFHAVLTGRNTFIQYDALRILAGRDRPVEPKVLSRLAKSKDSAVRLVALEAAVSAGLDGFRAIDLAANRDPIARQAAAKGLGTSTDPGSLDAIHRLLSDEVPLVRRAAIHAAAVSRRAESIPALITRLETEAGRLRSDLRDALWELTGRDYGIRPGTWRKFWSREGQSFAMPTVAAVRALEADRDQRRAKGGSAAGFYGVSVVSDHFALIIDVSGSMEEPAYTGETRVDVAKKQLSVTLGRLAENVMFNIIAFSDVVSPMDKRLVQAKGRGIDRAQSYVESLSAGGGTNIYNALEAAFADESIDTIYLLSDGDPSAGDVIDPDLIRADVARWNTVRRVVIHCVAVGQDHELLRGLAADHGGEYVRVD